LEHKKEYVHECFNTIAGNYDQMNHLMTWGMLKGWQDLVMKKAAMPKGGMGLDVCCGTGEMAFQLKEIGGEESTVYGLDFSENMLEVANAKLEQNPQKNMQFVQGDAMNLPFEDGMFDAITNGFALRNVLDIPKTISEMARVAKPGGKVVCIDVSRPKNIFCRMFFNVYYFHVVPLLGKLMGNKQKVADTMEPYKWLAESLRTFPNQDTILSYFEQAGLKDCGYKGVGFGASTVYWGTK